MNQSKASARYYQFEDLLWEQPSFAPLKKPVPIEELRLLAKRVWVAEHGMGPCPTVRSIGNKGSSVFHTSGKRGTPGRISLCTPHRNVGGLLHEIAHALGCRDKLTHGPAFRRRATRLYKLYGGWSGVIDWDNQERP